jgi:hypothetical protein
MKRGCSLLILVFLISGSFFGQTLAAQEKTKEEKDRELKLQQSIDQQKKAVIEQNKALEEKLMDLENQAKRMDERGAKGDNSLKFFDRRPNPEFKPDDPDIFAPQGTQYPQFRSNSGNSERTTWDLSKSIRESTFSKEYSFNVEDSVRSVIMSIMGDCKSGEIKVVILMPGGKPYSDIVIDEFGNLNWRKSFQISRKENNDKVGEWIFKINTRNASGFFKISLQTF